MKTLSMVLVPLPGPLPMLISFFDMAFILEHKMVNILRYKSCRALLQKGAGHTPGSDPSLGSALSLEPRPQKKEEALVLGPIRAEFQGHVYIYSLHLKFY